MAAAARSRGGLRPGRLETLLLESLGRPKRDLLLLPLLLLRLLLLRCLSDSASQTRRPLGLSVRGLEL